MSVKDRHSTLTPVKTDIHDTSPDSQSRMRNFGLWYGRQIYRMRWLVLITWVVLLAVTLPLANLVQSALKEDTGLVPGSESAQVNKVLSNDLHYPLSQIIVVFQSASTPVTDAAYQHEINTIMQRARPFPTVKNVTPGVVGKDNRTTYITINFTQDLNGVGPRVPDLRHIIDQAAAGAPAHAYLTGDPELYAELLTISENDLTSAESAALSLSLVVLLAIFGTLVAALMPILLVIVALLVALAGIYLISLHVTASTTLVDLATLVGIGISIDYSLFLTRRFREELASGKTTQEAVAWTIATAGEAILFSGLTVMIGFAGLFFLRLSTFVSYGFGGIAIVASALLATLTLLPALFSVLGKRINALRIPVLARFSGVARRRKGQDEQAVQNRERRGAWHAVAMMVMHHPVSILLLVTALLVGGSWPVFSLRIGTPTSAQLPANSEMTQGLSILQKQFAATNQNVIEIVAQTPDGSSVLTQANLNRVEQFTQWLSRQAHITSVTALTNLPATPGAPALGTQQLINLYTSGDYRQTPALTDFVSSTTTRTQTLITATSDTVIDSHASQALITALRTQKHSVGQGLVLSVGGVQASFMDYYAAIYGNFPWSVLFILLTTYIVLLLTFRSVWLPLKAVLMNILSIGVSYGVLVLVFQWGNLSHVLHFTSDGFIDSSLPVLLFCILFGLSMDYEVFLLSRIREEWLKTGNNREAVARGLEKTGGVITSAALLFVITTGAFIFTTITSTKELGLGLTVAILADATLIRSLLVPATMQLMGRWNWWFPGRRAEPAQLKGGDATL